MIQQRGGRWRVVVQAGRDPFTHKRRQLSASAGSEAGARRLEAELLARAAKMVSAAGDEDLTLAQVVDEWWTDKPRLGPATALNYRQNLDRHILPALGERPVREIRPRLVAGFLRHLAEKSTALGPATVRKVRTVLSAVMSYAVAMEHVESNPVMKVPPPELTGDEQVAPTLEETVRILIAAESDPTFLTYLWLAAEAGGRRGEILALRWGSIDEDAGTIRIKEAVSVGADGVHARPRTKTGNDRTVAISTVSRRLLDAHRRRVEESLSNALGRPTTTPSDRFVFTEMKGRRAGQPWRPDSTSRRFKRAKERAGVNPAITLHGLRHMMVTELIADDVDPRTVMGRAGHSTERMTLAEYAKVRAPKDAAAAERFGQTLDAERERQHALARDNAPPAGADGAKGEGSERA